MNVFCSPFQSQVEPESQDLEARIPDLRLDVSEDAEYSLAMEPDREESSRVRIEDVSIQPKPGLDVPSQQITAFFGSRGGKVHKSYHGGDLGAAVSQNKRYSTRSLTSEKGK